MTAAIAEAARAVAAPGTLRARLPADVRAGVDRGSFRRGHRRGRRGRAGATGRPGARRGGDRLLRRPRPRRCARGHRRAGARHRRGGVSCRRDAGHRLFGGDDDDAHLRDRRAAAAALRLRAQLPRRARHRHPGAGAGGDGARHAGADRGGVPPRARARPQRRHRARLRRHGRADSHAAAAPARAGDRRRGGGGEVRRGAGRARPARPANAATTRARCPNATTAGPPRSAGRLPGRPRGRAGASRIRSSARFRASARRVHGPRSAIGRPIEMSIMPGRSRKLLRGQQRADVTAIGTIGMPLLTARRLAPLL